MNAQRLYSHTTDGGAEYLCTKHIDGCSEGDLSSAVIRLDGEPEFINSVYAAAPDLLESLKELLALLEENQGVALWYLHSHYDHANAAILKAEEE